MLEINKLIEAKKYLIGYKVVLFDLDDTLYSEKDYVKSGYKAIARCYTEIEDMEKKLWSAFENGEKAIDFVLNEEGLCSKKNISDCLSVYRNHYPQIAIYSDAKKLLDYLKTNGIRMGMITDGRSEGQRAKINALNIENYFDKIIITDELGDISFRKPNVRAYEAMRNFFGVPYNEMVYVGDNPFKDFIAPQKLGMDYIYFNNPNGLYSNKGC